MIQRRTLLATSAALLAAPRLGHAVTVGVTATELKIGNFMPYSGPASAYGVIGRGDTAFFKMINDQGGVGGRQINYISYDDGYSPPRSVEQTRRWSNRIASRSSTTRSARPRIRLWCGM